MTAKKPPHVRNVVASRTRSPRRRAAPLKSRSGTEYTAVETVSSPLELGEGLGVRTLLWPPRLDRFHRQAQLQRQPIGVGNGRQSLQMPPRRRRFAAASVGAL